MNPKNVHFNFTGILFFFFVVCRAYVSGLVLKFSCIVYDKQIKIELLNKRHFMKNKSEIMQRGLKFSNFPCCQYI